ncbi:sugar ABC transporter ATP-binding protein [Mesorhizobium sp. M0701]|uniref:sugar ABC transporter ATP-binding protein n=1 Tax=Mesorhizobium sp. M0701 TaxID=2956989 RepID=UPI0033393BA6
MLTVSGVSMSFPGVRALSDASLILNQGEVHALMGENGAGKSTLIKIITGVQKPDGGRIQLDNTEITLANTREAIRLGISAVHQERNLIPAFSVAENIMLEQLPTKGRLVDFDRINREAKQHLQKVGLDVDPSTEVRRLSVAQMQMVEIAKALSHEAKVLLLDEPTASLTSGETEIFFKLVRQLRNHGTAILFVSHKLEEVLSICDRVTVLRDGHTTLMGAPTVGMTRQTLIEAMIGRAERVVEPRVGQPDLGQVKLEAREVSTAKGHAGVNFKLHKGEVLGFYGLVGAGRTELARALIGKDAITAGEVLVDGKPVRIHSIEQAAKRYRMGYVSEDRKFEGVILSHPIRSNVAITVWDRIAGLLGFLTASDERKVAAPLSRQLEIRTPNLEQLVGNLSGGNQQKVSLAKWLAADVDILIIDEPTVGIDIKAKAQIQELIYKLVDNGKSVLLISSDMPEMVALADRILIFHAFRICGEYVNDRRYDNASRAIMSAIHAAQDVVAKH